MLRIVPSTSAAGAKRYFDDALSRGDYYLEGQELAGSWGGEAAKRLGLEGEVSREAFHGLCDNINPATGGRLTARNRAGRRVGYDFNFHCPKSVSAVYGLTEDARILEAFRASVQETMRELERDTECRVRDKGQNSSRKTGNMVWGEFVHMTSRPVDGVPDPHLHAHCFAFNATWDHEQEMWKAADFGNIKRDARYFEAAFHARFAGRMAEMGYPIRRDGKGYWDIAGIPTTVRDKFSRRTAEIEQLAKELGIVDSDKVAELGAKSREAKAKNMAMEELRHTWDSWLTEEERDAIFDSTSGADGTPRVPDIDAGEAVTYGVDHLFERKSVAGNRELAETALRRGVGSVAVESVWQHMQAMEDVGTLLTGERNGQEMVTTREVLNEEREMIAFARAGRGACRALGRSDYVFQDALFHDPTKDTAEQRAAIREVLGSHDRVIDVRGGAGTGKTTLMREVVLGLEDGGHQVHAFAPTAEASRGVLRTEGFENADTVARLLMDRELQNQISGQVLWIDEAGLLGARSLNAVFRVADKQGCRVILTGDTKQHSSVERGDALRVLEQQGGVRPIEITKIQRQRIYDKPEPDEIKDYRQAVKHLSEGNPERGFKSLERLKAVTAFDIDVSSEERSRTIASDYLEALEGRNQKGKQNTVLAVSPTHAEGNAVTHFIREGLKQAGKIENEDRDISRLRNLNWTEAERGDAERYQQGQIIQFHQNVKGGIGRGSKHRVVSADRRGVSIQSEDGTHRTLPLEAARRFSVYEAQSLLLSKGDNIRITQNGFTADRKHRLNNGALYSVAGFTKNGNIRLNNGWEIDGAYGHLAHGYVTTSHASQGKTVDVVLIAQSAQSLPASSLEQFYVSVSRGRERVHVYTDDKDGLRDAIRRSGQRMSATELAGDRYDRARDRRRTRQYRQTVGRYRNRLQQRKERDQHEQELDRA